MSKDNQNPAAPPAPSAEDLQKDLEKSRAENEDLKAALAAAEKDAAEGGKAARGEEIKAPDWKKPDYNGPITSEIAAFRNRAFDVHGNKVVCRDGFEIDSRTGCARAAKGK